MKIAQVKDVGLCQTPVVDGKLCDGETNFKTEDDTYICMVHIRRSRRRERIK